MSVIGIDFGDESITVAAARHGVIDVLQNDIGKRKTRSIVAYGPTQRFIADDASAQLSSNRDNTVIYAKRLLGTPFASASVAREQRFCPAKIAPDANGRAAFSVTHGGSQLLVSPEEVVAALLGKIKTVCADQCPGQLVSECAISVPAWFTDAQRRGVLAAARLAGLTPLCVVNNGAAIAVQYALRGTIPPGEERTVVFYDIGATSTEVTVALISADGLAVQSSASDPALGGRDFTELIVEKLAADIQAKYKLDVHSSPKALLKLRKECTKVMETLSANTKVPYTIEYLMDGKDVSGVVLREEFEALLARDLKSRLTAVLDSALESAGITAARAHSIEVVGGGTRVPYVQALLRAHTGRELSKTCDADESVSWGTTLLCAMQSDSFKVRPFDVALVAEPSISVGWSGPVPDAPASGVIPPSTSADSVILFNRTHPIPGAKVVTIRATHLPVQGTLVFVGGAPTVVPSDRDPALAGSDPDAEVMRFTIHAPPPGPAADDLAAAAAGGAPLRIKMKVRHDANSLFAVMHAQAILLPPGVAPSSAADKAAKKIDLTVHRFVPWELSGAALAEAENRFSGMVAADAEVRATAEACSELEGFILEQLGKLPDSAPAVSILKKAEMWMEDVSETATRQDYVKKLVELKRECAGTRK